MTTIVGLVHAGRIYMGGDSCVTEGDSIWLQGQPKVFALGPVLVGIFGSGSFESAMRSITWQRPPDGEGWLRDELPARVREVVEAQVPEDGSDADTRPRHESGAMIGYRGKLWYLEASGALCPYAGTWAAAGSGADPARAVLRYTASRTVRKALALTPRDRLAAALEAAEALTANTRRPFKYVSEK